MQKGDIVVVSGAPARFKNLKNGTLWKVTGVQGDGLITVGDAAHPNIQTMTQYFIVLDDVTKAAIGYAGGTDLAIRLEAIESFRTDLQAAPTTPQGFVRARVNGADLYFARAAASALSKRRSDKLVQRRLIAALGGL